MPSSTALFFSPILSEAETTPLPNGSEQLVKPTTTPDAWVGVGLYSVVSHLIFTAVVAAVLATTPAVSAPAIAITVASGISLRMPSPPSLPACAGAWLVRGRLPRGRIVGGRPTAHNIPEG